MRALIVIFVIICAASCTERKRSNSVLRAEAYYVSDDKQFCDCLSTIYPDFKYDRMIKIKYKVINETNETYCIPFPDDYEYCNLPVDYAYCNSTNPFINVYFTNGVDTVSPCYEYKASKYRELSPGDSLSIYLCIYRFKDWGVSWCSVDNELSELLKMLKVNYTPHSTSIMDKYRNLPRIDFVNMSQHTRIVKYN